MNGNLYAFWGEQSNPRQIGRTGRYFTYGTDKLVVNQWPADAQWFLDSDVPPRFCYRGPGGSPKKVTGRPMVVEYHGHHINQMVNAPREKSARLNRITDGMRDRLGEFIREWHVETFVAYLGKFYTGLKRLPPSEKQRVLNISTRPYIDAGCDIGIDSLSLEQPDSEVQLYARWLESLIPGQVWGETVPPMNRITGWTKMNIICTSTGWRKWIVPMERVNVNYTDNNNRRYMIWPLRGVGATPRKRCLWVMDRLREGYDCAMPVEWARLAGLSAKDMTS